MSGTGSATSTEPARSFARICPSPSVRKIMLLACPVKTEAEKVATRLRVKMVLVSNGDPRVSDPVLLTAASGLVDLIIGVGETGAVDCAGAWHNESSDGTAMVLVHDSPQYVGIVRVSKNQHGLSFQSSHTII